MMGYYASVFDSLPAWLSAVIMFFLLVLTLMWILLPFALVAIQKKVNKILEANLKIVRSIEETNRLLYQQNHRSANPVTGEDSTDQVMVEESGRI
jgi:hypothetical protein